ncbi:MAG: iron-sulfur cluster assembly scaffold protein [Syntrophales bacterium]
MDKHEETITRIMLGMLQQKAEEIYSEKIIRYGIHPKNYGTISKPDGYASEVNKCGENIEMFLRISNDRIEDAVFTTDGCLFTVAAASACAEMAKGKRIRECLKINQSSIMAFLESMPEDHGHCAFHAALTLHRALRNYAICSRGLPRKAEAGKMRK